VEQQGAATQEISASVTAVLNTSQRAVTAMDQAAEASRTARTASGEVQQAAGDVSAETGTLGGEVEQFLAALRDTGSDRRSYQRVAGDGRTVTLTPRNGVPLRARLKDLSSGGLGIEVEGRLPAGFEAGLSVQIEIVGAAAFEARVARVEGALVGLVLKAGGAAQATLEQVIASLQPPQRQAA